LKTSPHYITPAELYRDAFTLAHQIYMSGFKPDFIMALWRGGTPVGIIVQEYLAYRSCPSDHIAVRTSSYHGDQSLPSIRIHGLDYIVDHINSHQKLLIVDDVFDTGRTLEALLQNLQARTRSNCPGDIRLATPWYKPKKNLTQLKPHYYLRETQEWLVFPHELQGLSKEQIMQFKDPAITPLLEENLSHPFPNTACN